MAKSKLGPVVVLNATPFLLPTLWRFLESCLFGWVRVGVRVEVGVRIRAEVV